MEITETVNKLIELLLDISGDDDDFVKFVTSAAGVDENRETLIDPAIAFPSPFLYRKQR